MIICEIDVGKCRFNDDGVCTKEDVVLIANWLNMNCESREN